MEETIRKYIFNNNQKFQRYNSWNHCFQAFSEIEDEKLLSLHLGFYLASWGMYRGSSKLLERDYLVHVDAVKIIKNYFYLRCYPENEVAIKKVEDITNLIEELSFYYQKTHNVTPTDTLISKIILGTLGCLPAFDRFFIDGVKQEQFGFKTLKPKSLTQLFEFVDENNQELKLIRTAHPQYPIMKIVDMYFWQIGYEQSNKK
ncbi:hypothetical protein [Maribacter hydrothermalis]|uniref:Uncharacterized protein n=1 Tax=Maribacter hydrothermalis TaxID=1836467 RepID=A0A1B7ZD35_9FLAO|nr:hypothetical protein [Maribacter hydrothermalis]APQ18785.1 hypothetical protein BTR34_16325 [Maribacter hydrothermalis]OBR41029.1 hypothetical protein A9200_14500 [Maribacter hydrothermalis]